MSTFCWIQESNFSNSRSVHLTSRYGFTYVALCCRITADHHPLRCRNCFGPSSLYLYTSNHCCSSSMTSPPLLWPSSLNLYTTPWCLRVGFILWSRQRFGGSRWLVGSKLLMYVAYALTPTRKQIWDDLHHKSRELYGNNSLCPKYRSIYFIPKHALPFYWQIE